MTKFVVPGVVLLATVAGAAKARASLIGVSVTQNSYIDSYQYRGTTFHMHPLLTVPNGSPSESFNDPAGTGAITVTMSGTFATSATSLSVSTVGTTKSNIDRAWADTFINTTTTFSVDSAQQYDFSLRTQNSPRMGSYDQSFTLKAGATTILSGELSDLNPPYVTGLTGLGVAPGLQDLFGSDQRLSLVPGVTYTLTFTALTAGDSYVPNNVTTMSATLTAVPEPAAGMLVGLAGAVAASARRRRQ